MSSKKREMFNRLLWEVRASQNATDRFDQAVADTIGLNRTDLRLLDLLDQEGRLTAGQLAERSGLSAGATTTAIDRLEQAGHARRVRDTDDRRRIYVEATEQAQQNGSRFYGEHAALAEELYHHYTEEQIGLLVEFVQRGREFNERKAAELEAGLGRDQRT